jgi:hypothetical protein
MTIKSSDLETSFIDFNSVLLTDKLQTISRWNLFSRWIHRNELDREKVCKAVSNYVTNNRERLESSLYLTVNLQVMRDKFSQGRSQEAFDILLTSSFIRYAIKKNPYAAALGAAIYSNPQTRSELVPIKMNSSLSLSQQKVLGKNLERLFHIVDSTCQKQIPLSVQKKIKELTLEKQKEQFKMKIIPYSTQYEGFAANISYAKSARCSNELTKAIQSLSS